jgi:hypothetical protein
VFFVVEEMRSIESVQYTMTDYSLTVNVVQILNSAGKKWHHIFAIVCLTPI